MTAAQVRRKGRPPKSDKGPATTSISMRVRPEVYEDIRRDAERHGRSVAAQAELRAAHPEPEATDVGRMIGLAVRAVEQRAGCSWSSHDGVKRQCRAAADFILNVLLGSPSDIKAIRSAIGFQIMVLESASSNKGGIFSKTLAQQISKEGMKDALGLLDDWSKGQKQADDTLEAVLGSRT